MHSDLLLGFGASTEDALGRAERRYKFGPLVFILGCPKAHERTRTRARRRQQVAFVISESWNKFQVT